MKQKTTFGFWIAALAACCVVPLGCGDDVGSGGGTDTDDPTTATGGPTTAPSTVTSASTGSQTDSESDTDSDTDSDSDTDGTIPSVAEIMAGIELGTAWADVPDETKEHLATHAADRYSVHAGEWGAAGLQEKLDLLLGDDVPAAALATFDNFVLWSYGAYVPEGFSASADVANAELRQALLSIYLIKHATLGASMRVFGLEDAHEWDGEADLQRMVIPDVDSFAAAKELAGEVVALLQGIGGELTPEEAALRERALYTARAQAHGSWDNYAYGTDDVLSLQTRTDYAVGTLFGWFLEHYGDDQTTYLHDLNAFMMAPTEGINVGTLQMFNFYFDFAYWGEGAIAGWTGGGLDPETDETAKAFRLMVNWWAERVRADEDATVSCTAYDDGAQAALWDAWSADSKFDNEQAGSFADYQALFDAGALAKLERFKGYAIRAVEETFGAGGPGDGLLAPADITDITAQLNALSNGADIDDVPVVLDEALTAANPKAATFYEGLYVGTVETVGPETPPQEAQAMWAEVRAYLDAQYSADDFDVAALLPTEIVVGETDASSADISGTIEIGFGVDKPIAQVYTTMIHEAHHALSFQYLGAVAEGPAREGAATLAELEELEGFLGTVVGADDIALHGMSMVAQATRIGGRTAATLAVLTRSDCNGPDSVDYAQEVAAQWGVEEDALEQASVRAHQGTQYLQYAYGEVDSAATMGWLRTELALPSLSVFDVIRCGVVNPGRDDATLATMQACTE